jgi:excinuclease UvrABC nuclease subunit
MNLITIENIPDEVKLYTEKKYISEIPVVYFIMLNNKILYIGHTINLRNRCIEHRSYYKDKNTYMKYIICESKNERKYLEKKYIEYYFPKDNLKIPNKEGYVIMTILDTKTRDDIYEVLRFKKDIPIYIYIADIIKEKVKEEIKFIKNPDKMLSGKH